MCRPIGIPRRDELEVPGKGEPVMHSRVKSLLEAVVIIGVVFAFAFALGPAFAQSGPDQVKSGRELMIEGAELMMQGKDNITGLMEKNGKPDAASEGAKMISDGYVLVNRADNIWTPEGDNPEDARQMMFQGVKMMLDGKRQLLLEVSRDGLSEKATQGRDMLLNGEIVMTRAQEMLK
jgi:hypothetical protein